MKLVLKYNNLIKLFN
jgi:hypothetical protein